MTTITVLNIKDIANTDYAFRGWSDNTAKLFNIGDYKVVYVGGTSKEMLDASDYIDTCDDLFAMTNSPMGRPNNYYGHSMSVSDVIIFSDLNGIKAFYCDNFGWHPISAMEVSGCGCH